MTRTALTMKVAALTATAAICVGANAPAPEIFAAAAPAVMLLQAHNVERRGAGVLPMRWDPALAAAAASYAAELAATDKWGHSAAATRKGQGENLWMGTRGAFPLKRMVGDWASEKTMFRPGTFPQVSTTGNWHDVGHYTQIVWPETNRIGCAVRSSKRFDYLVCRYAQPGNVMGQAVGGSSFRMAAR